MKSASSDTRFNLKFILPGLFTMLGIFWASSQSDITIFATDDGLDNILSNIAHIPVFMVLSLFWFKALKAPNIKNELLIVIGLLLFAISDEFHQSMVPGRTFAISDLILDWIGIFSGFAIHKMFHKIIKILEIIAYRK